MVTKNVSISSYRIFKALVAGLQFAMSDNTYILMSNKIFTHLIQATQHNDIDKNINRILPKPSHIVQSTII